MRYELIYLIGASEEANIESIKQEVEKIVSDFGGNWEEKEWTEKKRLAYKIGKDYQGTYIAKRFSLEEKDNMTEINTQIKLLAPRVLRFMISRTDDLPELGESMESNKKESRDKEAETNVETKVEAKKEEAPAEKEEKVIKEKTEEESKKEEKKESQEDIDKKLEEILNI